jgi:hypothetical protein
MTDVAPNQSARILGQDYGLTAVEMNFLLKEEGFLEGEPGAYSLTDKGREYADEQDHHRGPGGYSWYNRDWQTRTWNPAITDELDVSDGRKRQIREAAAEARRQKAAASAIEVGGPAETIGADEPGRSGVDPLTVAVGVALAAVSIYGIKKVAPHLRALWTDKAAPRFKRSKDGSPSDADAAGEPPTDGDNSAAAEPDVE